MGPGILRRIRYELWGRCIAVLVTTVFAITGCVGNTTTATETGVEKAEPAALQNDQLHPTRLNPMSKSERAYAEELRGASFDQASARDLFRGVLFNDGPVVDLIPSLKRNAAMAGRTLTPAERQASQQFLDRLMDDIEQQNPGALEAFKADLLTRQHVSIQRALVKGVVLAKTSLKRLPETKDLDFNNADPSNRGLCGLLVFVAGVVVLVVAVAGAAAVVVVVDAGLFIHVTEVYTKSVDEPGFYVFTDPNHPSGCPNGDCGDFGSGSQSLIVETLVQDIAELPVPVWSWAHTSTEAGFDVTQATFYTDQNRPQGLKLGDFDGDGNLDRAYFDTTNPANEVVSIVEGRNCPDRKCVAAFTESSPRGAVPVIGDFDGNGRSDILWWTAGSQHPIWFFTSGTQHTVGTLTRAGTSGGDYRVVAGDFNGDSVDDLFWYGTGSHASELLLGSATGSFASIAVPALGGAFKPIVGKFFQGSGDDILFYDPSVSAVADHPLWDFEPGTAPGTLTLNFYTAPQAGGSVPIPADIDGNGRDDFLWYFPQSTGDDAIQQWRFNDLTGVDLTTAVGPGPGAGYFPVWGDTNNNGYADVIWWPFSGRDVPVNLAPIAVCQAVTASANASCGASVSAGAFDGGSSDPDHGPLTLSVAPAGPYGLGTTNVTLTVSDGLATSSCTTTVTVADTSIPAFTAPADIITDSCIVNVSVPTAADNCDATPEVAASLTSSAPPTPLQGVVPGSNVRLVLPPGQSTIQWTATDGLGVNQQTQHITVSHPYITQATNGDVKYSITFAEKQAYVEAFVKQNGVQNISGNIVSSEVHNANGTYTYSRVAPASMYHAGDAISVRFYSYKAQGPGVFSPGPTAQYWLTTYFYGVGIDCAAGCHPYIRTLPNGSLQFSVTFSTAQTYVEAFVRRGTTQIASGNIVGNVVRNSDGSFTYNRVIPANQFSNGNQVTVRFYAYIQGQTPTFLPGPSNTVWSTAFVVGTPDSVNCLAP